METLPQSRIVKDFPHRKVDPVAISYSMDHCQVLPVRCPVRIETGSYFEDFPWSAAGQSNLGQRDS
jgi:hypothetical protein